MVWGARSHSLSSAIDDHGIGGVTGAALDGERLLLGCWDGAIRRERERERAYSHFFDALLPGCEDGSTRVWALWRWR